MKNAHERFGWLEFEKQLKDTRTRLRVALDRFISEPAEDKEASGTCHLVSVFGSDVDAADSGPRHSHCSPVGEAACPLGSQEYNIRLGSGDIPLQFSPHSGTGCALQMRRIRRWLISFNVSPSDLLMQRRTKQIQPTDLKIKAIGAVVREFRKRAGHSQERLSGECGFDRTYISRVERGIINPTVGRLWQIADALKTPLSQLTKRMELWIADQLRVSRRGDTKRT